MISIHLKKIGQVSFGAAVDGRKVLATTFTRNEEEALENLLENLPYNMPFQVAEKQDAFSEKLLSTLEAIYDGRDTSTDFKLSLEYLSKYSQKVLKCVWKIPVGYLTSYGAVAKTCGGSPRAVGRVMATNPFAPLIPCHRVVQADFSIGGYGGGTQVKWKILQREDRGYREPKDVRTECGNLHVYPVGMLMKESKRKG